MSNIAVLLQKLKRDVILRKNRGDIIKKKVSKKEKRRLTFIILTFIGIISFMCVNIIPDLLKISNNKKETVLLQSSYEDLLDKEKSLKSEVQKLKNPAYLERFAKEKFFYTNSDDIIIRKTGQ